MAARGGLELIVSIDVLTETERNLRRKVPRAMPSFELLTAILFPEAVQPAAELVRQVASHIAQKDAPIVAAAVQAEANFLATYDQRHLLAQAAEIEARYHLIVTTPDQILAAAAEQEIGR